MYTTKNNVVIKKIWFYRHYCLYLVGNSLLDSIDLKSSKTTVKFLLSNKFIKLNFYLYYINKLHSNIPSLYEFYWILLVHIFMRK